MSVLALHLVFGEGREIHKADTFAHRQRLLLHSIPPVGALEGIFLAFARLVVPARTLPAENLGELRAFSFQLVIKG